MHSLTSEELQQWQAGARSFQLLDVREPWEHEAYNIGGSLLPLGSIIAGAANISREIPTVIYCEKGIRSIIAIQRLEGLGFENLYNLTGGMNAWRASVGQILKCCQT